MKQLDSCILPLASSVKDTPPINHCRFKKCVLGDLTRREEIRGGGWGAQPSMQDASPKSDPGSLYFAPHCNTSRRNAISIFLLHSKVAENNTLNGVKKMKYVLSPASYTPPPPPQPSLLLPSACLHTNLI